ncbi:MAG: hypothetical protein IKG27_04100 [Bacilli bacterium]|nr:hypothetical protein [Bacilli bacterium]
MKKYRKQIKLGVLCLVIILFILSIWLFVVPSFNGNKYGDRLRDEKKYKISEKAISSIKDKAKKTDGIVDIEYHKEGRVLNFAITTADDFGINQAKDFANSLLSEIGEESLKYYDIQFFIDSKGENGDYPIIGYKSKNSEGINYGNVGG